jgi:hypothetical protein
MKQRTIFFITTFTCFALAALPGKALSKTGQQTRPSADSIQVPASRQYQKPGILRKIFIGKNYRVEWGTPVTMAVFRLKDFGMTVKELGGGQQTKSLRLTDKDGKEWVLRTVDKDVEKALPPKLRNTLAEGVVQDLISAAYPYAPLIVANLSQTVAVPAPAPRLFYVPDDAALGPHQKIFAHQICYLEKRDPTDDGSESINSEDVQKALGKNGNSRILQKEVLRARLVDMLIADWDRHADQWRWGAKDSAGARYFYAIPRDRDQAFFRAGGLIPRVGKAVAMQHLNWFKKHTRGLKKLNFKSRDFDRIYLNELTRNDWETITQKFIETLSDPVIDAAAQRIPPAVYRVSGKVVAAKLKSRRSSMLQPVLSYYRDIAREVQVWGTQKEEWFTLTDEDGRLRVQVFAMNKEGQKGLLRYDRVFEAGETKKLHLEGLGGADRFEVISLPRKSPQLHLYGSGENAVFSLPAEYKRRVKIHTGTDAAFTAKK